MHGCREVESEGADGFESGQTDAQRTRETGKKGRILKQTSPFPDHPFKTGGMNTPDLFTGEWRRGRARRATLEYSIISTATGHLATGYTMAAVSLATARLWSGRMLRQAARETGRQMD